MERRRHPRVSVSVPIKLPRFTLQTPFPGLKRLLSCDWKCRDISCAGMLLEARGSGGRVFVDYLKVLLESFFTGIKEKGKPAVYYPILPPERLKVSVEIKVSPKTRPFIHHGSMAWFKPYGRGSYRMGIIFDGVE